MFYYSHYAWEFSVVFLFCNVALDVLSSFVFLMVTSRLKSTFWSWRDGQFT